MTQPREEPIILDVPFNQALERFARINPCTPEEPPQRRPGEAAPFVKWVGGKRSVVNELILTNYSP